MVVSEVLMSHLPDAAKSRAQYLDILRDATRETPKDPRNRFYYARELWYYGKWIDAAKQFSIYLQTPGATNAMERSYACSTAALCMHLAERKNEAEILHLRACAECPDRKEAWFHLGDYYRIKGLLDVALICSKKCINIKTRPMTYLDEMDIWNFKAYDLFSVCSFYAGDKRDSLIYARKALEGSPSDERLKDNLRLVEEAI